MESERDHECLGCGRSVESATSYCPNCMADRALKHPGSVDSGDDTTPLSNEELRKPKPISLGILHGILMKDVNSANPATKVHGVPMVRKSAHAHINECPECGLINPPTAQSCDCGHTFGTQTSGKAMDHPRVREFAVSALRARDGYWIALICLLFLALGPASIFVIFFDVFVGGSTTLLLTVSMTLVAGFTLSFYLSKMYPRLYWLWGLFYMIFPFMVGIAFGKSDISSTLIFKSLWIGFSVILYLSTWAGGRTAIRRYRHGRDK